MPKCEPAIQNQFVQRVAIKICGITQMEQAIEIARLGVDAIGFILYPPSPRFIEPSKIKAIVLRLPPLIKTVGVFVDEPMERLIDTVRNTGIDLAQLHGSETPEYCRRLSDSGIPWIKAFRIRDRMDIDLLPRYPTKNFLLDAWSDKAYGGTGKTFDWSQAKKVCAAYRIILAGGLTPENVSEAIGMLNPYGLDISSGVEKAPGIKSIDKVKTLLKAVESPLHNQAETTTPIQRG